ncbi:MAG TPA: glycosyltransferase family 2 protein [Candidatus Paceibacterota bacterium]|nr:glycosyltransferase family 2 protein [Candidatus Paceibacterota bacterium]
MNEKKRLSIVIVTYNSEREIGDCLKALDGFDRESIEMLIIDNASKDSTPEFLQKNYSNNPQYRLIFNSVNTGFAEGANQGFREAHSNIVLSINPDTIASVPAVMRMLEFFEKHPDIGILGPKITDANGTAQESYGEELTPWQEVIGKIMYSKYTERVPWVKKWKRKKLNVDTTHEVGWIGGACFMMRRAVYIKTGGIDQQFFLSHGDLIDLSKRVSDLGLKNILFAGSSIVHHGGGSSAGDRDAALRTSYIGTLYYFEKYYGQGTVILAKAVYVLSSSLKAATAFLVSVFRRDPYRAITAAHFKNVMRILTGTLGKIQ